MDGQRLVERAQAAIRAHPALVDAAWAAALLVLAVVSTNDPPSAAQTAPSSEPFGVALLLGATLPYAVRRKAPLAVFAVSALSVLVLAGVGYFEGATPIVALLGAYTVGARCRTRTAVLTYLALAGGLLTLFVSDPPGSFDFAGLLANLALFAVAFLVGANLTSRRTRVEALEQRAEALGREREEEARRAVSEERLRIAQELHDVVAHSMGVIAVQAGAGLHVIDADPVAAKRSLEAISGTSRSTLSEIRRLLGVLRGDDGTLAEYAPAPGAADLPALVDDV
ncbi:MAG: histidine kinase dimerization/phosphoacceptor domain-containing protein, partial [Acidimicrobiales bacterium]|nr:histidine kinase dimerization/phosphoacceptor domain-containing protein [Acidimicrobiales bacterium]